ncbi:alpha/beta hydrolase [Legionella jordanis]|uniref:Putative hydrolase n=1 Tax=Legionella jordanis TaxID=456 RepID=A0A0W0VBC6_9GAMM|nr:alpha/beta fold hydrolase [Legionella jordanis]KTD17424.1 putative hydrolase [Legionella jordanis]RMX01812.1 alpha/beta fold hydrolase [Legionella jordanis]RMX15476.1 alpha/beta fold hydrolase [Legionella jordanis]VEH11554.1 putative hydrolase [Legionella jordanis]HAT8714629.1 alpha/beta fold hydrolase [Legionella jordanis]
MVANKLTVIKDLMHAQLCYQLFITPIHLPIEKEYRDFARRACEFFQQTRTDVFHCDSPRHHVIHRFASLRNADAKKVLITHGWMSRAAYMIRLIHSLRQHGYEVYALDFPAHGEAKGVQLPWTDAVLLLNQVINQLGPFYAVIGHSFGGSMLLNTLNLAQQFPQWQLNFEPERVVLISSPTRMRVPVSKLARKLKLSRQGFLFLRELFQQHAMTDLKCLDFHHFISRSNIPVLCLHGDKDDSIVPIESIVFCEQYPHGHLALLPGANHVDVLWDERVEKTVGQFLF